MFTAQSRFVRLVGVLVLGLALSGCANTAAKDRAKIAYVERPVEQLFNDAKDKLDDKQWAESSLGFDEVERQHPYSEWARRSILMGAYSAYQQNKYEDSIAASQRFIALHPGNASAPYAYYLIAMCYFEQIVDVGRDQRLTELSLAALNDVAQRYPQSEYAKDARLKIDMTRDQLAGKEMEIGRYYLKQDEYLAAIGRFKRVIDYYQTTTHTPEALHRLVEAYAALGVTGEATQIASVLGYNYPGSEWYQESYQLLTSKGVSLGEPKPESKSWIGRLFRRS